jgi:hypothetical protein
MRIDIQIPAHLRQQVATDFFLPILESGESFAEVQATMAALPFVGHKLAGDLLEPRQVLYSPQEFRTLHSYTLGQICPIIKRQELNELLERDSRSHLNLPGAAGAADQPETWSAKSVFQAGRNSCDSTRRRTRRAASCEPAR